MRRRIIKPRHVFQWTCEGFVRVNRYGEETMDPEVVGATEKEAKELLAEGIALFLRQRPRTWWIGSPFTDNSPWW